MAQHLDIDTGQGPLTRENADTLWDACIIGAGPAGSIAAMNLARAHKVLLLDRHEFPREKVCGDGLIADSLRALEKAGLLEEIRARGHAMSLGKVLSPSRIEMRVPGEYITLRRMEIDAVLARAAHRAGAAFRRAHVASFAPGPDPDSPVTLMIKDYEKPIRTRVVVVATGVRVKLLTPHGMVQQPEPNAMAVRCYVRAAAPQLDHMIVSYDRSIAPGYSWIFPMKHGWYNMGCGVRYRKPEHRKLNLRHMFARFCAEFPAARRIMDSAQEQTPLRAAPLRVGLRGVSPAGPGPVLAIGECIGATYPFTGEGIGKAMETGDLAAQAIHAALCTGDMSLLRNFPDMLESGLRSKYTGYVIAENWLARPWVNDLVMARARRSPYLSAALAGIITETADPRAVFSIKGILKSLIS